MSIYIFNAGARQDLNDVIEYIARNNPSASVDFVRELERKCENLAKFPNMGKSYEYLAPRLRGFTIGSYSISIVRLKMALKLYIWLAATVT